MPKKILEQKDDKPIRIILDKTKTEKIGSFLWSVLKVGLLLFFLFSLFATASLVPSSHGIEKTYFDEYFGTVMPDPTLPEIAVISLSGQILDGPNDVFASPGSAVFAEDIIFLLSEAVMDPNVSAILLRIDSPGGTALAAERISHMIREIEKPVFALLEGMAASGGYYVASVTDKIYAYPATVTGSIGVLIELPEVSELLENIGVDIRSITSGEFKDIGSPFREMTAAERSIFEELVAERYAAFVETVAKGREMELSEVLELADGRIFSGEQAVGNGLADQAVHSFREVLEDIAGEIDSEAIQAVQYNLPLSPWEQLLIGVRNHGISLNAAGEVLEERISDGPRLWMH